MSNEEACKDKGGNVLGNGLHDSGEDEEEISDPDTGFAAISLNDPRANRVTDKATECLYSIDKPEPCA
jgi:hypothetical protein